MRPGVDGRRPRRRREVMSDSGLGVRSKPTTIADSAEHHRLTSRNGCHINHSNVRSCPEVSVLPCNHQTGRPELAAQPHLAARARDSCSCGLCTGQDPGARTRSLWPGCTCSGAAPHRGAAVRAGGRLRPHSGADPTHERCLIGEASSRPPGFSRQSRIRRRSGARPGWPARAIGGRLDVACSSGIAGSSPTRGRACRTAPPNRAGRLAGGVRSQPRDHSGR